MTNEEKRRNNVEWKGEQKWGVKKERWRVKKEGRGKERENRRGRREKDSRSTYEYIENKMKEEKIKGKKMNGELLK